MDIKITILSILTIVCVLPCFSQKKQHGRASYYSKKATGARSASGQRIHHDSLTCAHRFYPFGTMLKVTNLNNNKSVIVKVIDRGPFGRGRIIDLSWGAAKKIGMLSQGVATVKVEVQDNPTIPYRSKEENLPHIDFEMAESDFKFKPKWQPKAENGKNKIGKKEDKHEAKKNISKQTEHKGK